MNERTSRLSLVQPSTIRTSRTYLAPNVLSSSRLCHCGDIAIASDTDSTSLSFALREIFCLDSIDQMVELAQFSTRGLRVQLTLMLIASAGSEPAFCSMILAVIGEASERRLAVFLSHVFLPVSRHAEPCNRAPWMRAVLQV